MSHTSNEQVDDTIEMTIEDLEQMLDPDNARMHSQRSYEAVESSLKQFGAARSIVVDGDGVVRAGNGTVISAKAAGINKIKIVDSTPDQLVVVRRPDLKGDAAKAYALSDNQTGLLSSWDDSKLAEQLESLGNDFDMASVGFDIGELDDDDISPDDFPEVDETVETEHECPKCGYRFSGGRIVPKGENDGEASTS